MDIKQSLALISPYGGQIDSINFKFITGIQTVDQAVESLEREDGLSLFVHITDDNGKFTEIDIQNYDKKSFN